MQTIDGKFTVGEGATVCRFSDREAGTVVAISNNGKKVSVQQDRAVLVNRGDLVFTSGGFSAHVSGAQRYEYTTDPNGEVTEFSLRANGRWVAKGQDAKHGDRLIPGRHQHYDYNF
jgi:hypothetical protein